MTKTKFSKKQKKKLGGETEAEDSIIVIFNVNGLSYQDSVNMVKDGHSSHYLLAWKRIIGQVPKHIFPMIKEDNKTN